MASHFESSELQLTPQTTPLFAYMLYIRFTYTKKFKLKTAFIKQNFRIIGWGVTGAHEEYPKSVRPYVLFETMNGAAVIPLDILQVLNFGQSPPEWDLGRFDTQMVEDSAGSYALVQISDRTPSRKRWKQMAAIQRLVGEMMQESADSYEPEEEPEVQSSKKKKKKK
jgi:hypothetical protein